ncbi:MAG TPA: hypothetical protein VGM13_05845 [Thermoanaerobaculia bacterium]
MVEQGDDAVIDGPRPKCDQCERPSYGFFEGPNGPGPPLCVEHMSMLQNTMNRRLDHLRQRKEQLLDSMEFITGIAIPRTAPPTPIIQERPVYNTLRVTNSTIGAIVQGHVHSVEASVTVVQKSDPALAAALTSLTESVLNSKDLTEAAREEAVEQLAFISEQVAAKPEARKPGIVAATASKLGETVKVASSLYEGVKSLWPLLRSHFPGLPDLPGH